MAICVGTHVGPVGCRPSSADPPRLVDTGLAAVGRGDHATARQVMRDLRAAGATDASLVVQSAILVAKGHPIPALDVLSQVASSAWLDPPRRLVAATACQQLGRHRDVESLLTPVVAANPDLVDAHRLLAVSFYDVGAVQEAVHHLRETARLAPDDPRPHRLLGLMHSDYELFAEAIPCYEESLRRNPHQPDREEILLELATCLIRQLRPADALAFGPRQKLRIGVTRPSLGGEVDRQPVVVRWKTLPTGVAAPPEVTIPADQDATVVELVAGPDAAAGSFADLTVTATTTFQGKEQSAESAGLGGEIVK